MALRTLGFNSACNPEMFNLDSWESGVPVRIPARFFVLAVGSIEGEDGEGEDGC